MHRINYSSTFVLLVCPECQRIGRCSNSAVGQWYRSGSRRTMVIGIKIKIKNSCTRTCGEKRQVWMECNRIHDICDAQSVRCYCEPIAPTNGSLHTYLYVWQYTRASQTRIANRSKAHCHSGDQQDSSVMQTIERTSYTLRCNHRVPRNPSQES
jgi:hypothetical protein